mmetsp:Transcript_32008/g.51748  ORF Transcript_32008/g.51748 Transcript_32008/m.51748 type:complete len:490 (+) Transcript_32008:1210-2679(+)
MDKLCNFINGELVPPITRKYIENINPATNSINNYIPDSDSRDVEAAIGAAKAAYPKWRKAHFTERAVWLKKIADEMEKKENFDAFVTAEAKDMGKPVSMSSIIDVPGAISTFRKYAAMIESETTPYFQMVDAVGIEHRDPIGIVALITPWNFPLMLFCMKVAPAIVCGNVCVCKPSELSPTTAYLMSTIFQKVGLPNGVVNVVHGYGATAGEPAVKHPAIGAVSFTGGSVTGSRISSLAAPRLKKLQLELGGKNAAIVFDDCYFDETVDGIARAAFFNTGQVCCSGSRLLVQRGVADKFVRRLKEYARTAYVPTIGDPLKPGTLVGPLVSRQHLDKVASYLQLCKEEGGTVIFGGAYGEKVASRLGAQYQQGCFFEPTIVTGLSHTSRCATEEIFGPILTVHVFDNEDEAIAIANQVNYGLAASIWTSDIRRGQRVARELEAGSVWINCYLYADGRMAFGGFKNSGVQRENGRHSIDFFTEIKSITSKL